MSSAKATSAGLPARSPSLAEIFFGRLANLWRKRREQRTFTRRRLQFQAIEPRILLSADLVFNADVDSADDIFTLRFNSDTGNLEVLDGATLAASQALVETTGVIINGEANQGDRLIIDFGSGGFFSVPNGITFNGGTGASDNDELVVTGGSFTTATHTFTTTGPEHSGNIVYDDGAGTSMISYTGLEPIDMSGSTIENLVFNLPGTADLAILEDDATLGNGVSRLRSQAGLPTFDTTTFSNPASSLTVNMGGDSGSFTVASLPDFTAALTINGQGGAADTVTLTSPLTLASLSVTAESISINGGSVSTSGDQAYIGATVLGANTTLSGNDISFVGTLSISSGTMTLNAVTTVSTLNMSGGTLIGNGAVTVNTSLAWSGGTITGGGVLTTSGTTALGSATLTDKLWENAGVVNLARAGGQLILGGNGVVATTFTNQAGGVVNDASNSTSPFTFNTTAANKSVVNAGTFNKLVGSAATQTISIGFSNSGTVNIDSGTLNLTGSGSDTGTYAVDADQLLQFGGGVRTLSATSSLEGAGNLQVRGGTVTADGTNTLSGAMTFSGGTTTFTQDITPSSLTVNGGTLNLNASPLTFTDNLSVSAGVLNARGDITVNGSWGWSGGTITGAGLLTTSATASTALGSATLSDKLWENAGVVDLAAAGGQLILGGNGVVATTFTNQAGGEVNDPSNSSSPFTFSTTATNKSVVNAGTFNKLVGSAATQTIGIGFSNSGTVNIDSGTLNLTGSGSDRGIYAVDAGQRLQFGGGVRTLSATSSLEGAGNLLVSGGTVTANGTNTLSGSMTFSGGTTTFTQDITPGSLTVNGGTSTLNLNASPLTFTGNLSVSAGVLNARGDITVNGSWGWSGGTITGAGVLTTSATASTALGSATLSDKLWNNAGVVDLAAAGGQLILGGNGVVATTFTNQAGGVVNDASNRTNAFTFNTTAANKSVVNAGTFDKLVGSAATQTIDIGFSNSGTVNIDSGTLNITGALSQTGTIDVDGGTTFQRTGGFTNLGTLAGEGTFNVGAGTLTNSGTVAPGAASGDTTGTLRITGNYLQGASGQLEIELAGTTPGTFDVLAVTGTGAGTVTLSGALHAEVVGDFEPVDGDRFRFMTFTARSGDFVNTLLPAESFIDTHATDLELVYLNAVPSITIDKTVDANEDGAFSSTESVLEGGAGDQLVDYRFVITNTSPARTDPVTLTVTGLTDDRLGDLTAAFLAANGGSATIAVGQSVTFFVHDFLVPVANAGSSHVNTVAVTATDDEGTGASSIDFATVTYANAAPAVVIDKTVDADEDGLFASTESVLEGGVGNQLVDYRFVVANTSAASTDPLTVTGLTDDRLGDLTAAFLAANGGAATIAVGQSVTFFVHDFLVPVANAASSHVNTVSVVAFDDEGTETQGTDFATVTYADAAPTVTIDKTVDANEDGLFASTESVLEGGAGNQQADYRFVVSNTSTASTDPATVTVLSDDKLGNLMSAFLAANNGSAALAFGQSVTFFVLDAAVPPGNAGDSHVNTVTTAAMDDENTLTQATDFAVVSYANVTPTVAIDKTVDADGDGVFASTESVLEGGVGNQEADYRFVVANASAASTDPLTLVSLTDDKLGNLMAAFLAANGDSNVIAVGQSVTFFVNDFLLPVGNASSSQVNTVAVTAADDEGTGTQSTDFAVVTYANVTPEVAIDKSVDANGDGVFASSETLPAGGSGGQVDYRFVVSNTSTASTDPLTVTALIDDRLGDLTAAFLAANGGSNVVAVGASVTFFVLDAAVPPGNAGDSHVNTVTTAAVDDENTLTQATDFAVVTYANNAPALSISDVTVVEGDSGITSAIFSVSLSNPFSEAVSVEYSTAGGTASAGSDYNAGSGLVTFAPGETLRTITVAVNGDLVYEFDEIFLVNLANPLNGTLSDSQGIGTIVNDDAAPTLVISDATVLEGDAGSTDAVFTVSLIGATEVTAIVNFSTAGGTATAGSDYTATSGTLIFNPGDSTQTITVTVNGDLIDETDETFLVSLLSPTNAVIGDGQGVGTILDDDAATGGIDLQIEAKWDPDDLLIPGDHEHVTVMVSNTGDTAVHQQVKVKLYASMDRMLDGSDIFLDHRLIGSDIEPGISKTAQFNLGLPGTLLPGEYFVLAKVDPANEIAESNEENNTAIAGSFDFPEIPENFDFHWMFGQVPGHGWETLTVREADGTWVNFSLFGPGTGEITIDEEGGWDLLVTGTNGNSVLSILTLGGGDRRVEVDDIHVTGALRGILAPRMDLTGTLAIDGALGAGMMIGSATDAVIAVQTILGMRLSGLSVEGIAILGDLEDSEILIGADLGADGQLGGDGADGDTYSGGDLGDLLIKGSMISSCVRVGQDAGEDGIFDTGDDVLLDGSIDSIKILGEMTDDSFFVADDLPRYARIDGDRVYTETDPRFVDSLPEGGGAECNIDWNASAGSSWGYSPFASRVAQSNFSDFLVRLFG